MSTPPTRVEFARHKLERLYFDTGQAPADDTLTPGEREALRIVLDEIHRLNLAVSDQAKTIANHKSAKKQRASKPPGERSQASMTHRPRQKGAGNLGTLWLLSTLLMLSVLAFARPQGDKPTLIGGANSNNGQAVALATDANGVLATDLAPNSLSFEPGAFKSYGGAAAPLWTTESGEATHITSTTATAVRNNEGQLKSIIVGTPAAGTISVFDLAAGSCTGTPSTNTVAVLTITSSTPPQPIAFNAHLHNGICVQASATMDITVVRQ